MSHIFISYDHDDKSIMGRVREAFERAGLPIWTDEQNLKPGARSWKQAVQKALDSALCLVVIFTPQAKQSRWVNEELDYSDNRRLPIFPVLADGDEGTAVPFGFSSAQFVDIRRDETANLDRLIAELWSLIQGAQALRAEANTAPKKLASERYTEYWTQLLARSKGRTPLFSRVGPSNRSYLNTGAGKTDVKLSYVLGNFYITVQLYIDVPDATQNKALFDALYEQKAAIEAEIGEPLEWRRLDNTRASRIFVTNNTLGGLAAPDQWAAQQDWMIGRMIRFDAALRPRLAAL